MGEAAEQIEQEIAGQTERRTEHQSAGVVVLQWLTYAFWGWLIIGLIWMLTLTLMSFIYKGDPSDVADMLPYSIAVILVLLPAAFVLDLFYRRREPVKKSGASAVIMVIHAVIFALLGIGVLISSIFVALNAVISGRFSDGQTVAILTLLGATLLYAMTFLRTLRPARLAKFPMIYGVSMLVISLLMLVMGIVGPLASSIRTRDDRRIESYISDIIRGVDEYIRTNNRAPDSLNSVELSKEGQALVDDKLVHYKSSGRQAYRDSSIVHSYQLCATYSVEKEEDPDNDAFIGGGTLPYRPNRAHPKGEVCYDLEGLYYMGGSSSGSSLLMEGLEGLPGSN